MELLYDCQVYVSELEECPIIGRQLSVNALEGEFMAIVENSLSDRRSQVAEGRS
jgi:hypothetical protein